MSTDFIRLQRKGRCEREKFLANLESRLFLSPVAASSAQLSNYTAGIWIYEFKENEYEPKS